MYQTAKNTRTTFLSFHVSPNFIFYPFFHNGLTFLKYNCILNHVQIVYFYVIMDVANFASHLKPIVYEMIVCLDMIVIWFKKKQEHTAINPSVTFSVHN